MRFCYFSLLIIVLTSCLSFAIPAHQIQGTVCDTVSGLPLSGANIQLLNTTLGATSNFAGRFKITGLQSNSYRLRVSMMGYETLEKIIRIESDKTLFFDLKMKPTIMHMHQNIVVTAERDESNLLEVPQAMSVLNSAALTRSLPRSTPEALMQTAGVWMQKTNHGGGSPFVRGLVGNQVLVLVDGIRLNNATFRYGPNQYLNTIDPWQIERIEVLRGSGSVLYGSDALGGVINIISKRPRFSDGGLQFSANIFSKYMSSDMEKSGRIELGLGTSHVAILAGISHRIFGDIKAGGNLGIEAPSGYDEFNSDAKIMVRLSARQLLTLAFQNLRQNDVPRFDQVTQRGYQRYSFDPQIRRLAYAQFQSFASSKWAQTVNVITSLQHGIEQRVKEKHLSDVTTLERDQVDVYGISVQLHSKPLSFCSTTSGLDFYHDKVASWRKDKDRTLNTTTQSRGLYPNDATALSFAAFIKNSFNHAKIKIDLGLRFNKYKISASDNTFPDLDITPSALVSSVAMTYRLSPSHRFIVAISQGFRAPNINDMSSLGGFDYGIEVPGSNLSPEKTVNFETGLKSRTSNFAGSLFLYRTNLHDLIDRVHSTFMGSDYYQGQRVYSKQNVDKATIHGFEVETEFELSTTTVLLGNLIYTYGHKTSTDDAMRRIPPLNGQIGMRWQPTRRSWAEARLLFAGKQDRLAPGDIDDHRIPDGGTPGWAVANITGGYTVANYVEVMVGLQNLFNKAYRIHGSGVDGYGRSFWLGLNVDL